MLPIQDLTKTTLTCEAINEFHPICNTEVFFSLSRKMKENRLRLLVNLYLKLPQRNRRYLSFEMKDSLPLNCHSQHVNDIYFNLKCVIYRLCNVIKTWEFFVLAELINGSKKNITIYFSLKGEGL